MATTSALAPYPYLQMVWMMFFGYVVFDQLPDRWTLAGAAIIVASGLYIVHREHRLAAEEQHRAQQRNRGTGKKALKRRRRNGIRRI